MIEEYRIYADRWWDDARENLRKRQTVNGGMMFTARRWSALSRAVEKKLGKV